MESVLHTTRSDGWCEPTDIVSRKPPRILFQRPFVGPRRARSSARSRNVDPEQVEHRKSRIRCSGEAFSLQRDTRLSRVQFPAGPPTYGCLAVTVSARMVLLAGVGGEVCQDPRSGLGPSLPRFLVTCLPRYVLGFLFSLQCKPTSR